VKKRKCKRMQMPRRGKRVNGRYADHKRMIHEIIIDSLRVARMMESLWLD